MSGELEAAGAAVQAGLVAGAIERPGTGRGRRPAGRNLNTTGKCLNCDTPLEGAFCHACGQPAHVSRTLSGLLSEFLNAFLSFDTKAWRTLPQLVTRPGTFTFEYIHGHRARYVSPLSTFLFTVFLMFFVFSVVSGWNSFPRDGVAGDAPRAAASEDRAMTVAEAQTALTRAEQKSAEAHRTLDAAEAEAAKIEAEDLPGADGRAAGLVTGPEVKAELADDAVDTAKERLEDAKRRAERREKALAEASADLGEAKDNIQAVAPNAGVVVGAAKSAVDTAASRGAVDIKLNDRNVVDGDRPWQEELREAVESGDFKINTGYPQFDARIRAQLLNPELALYKLQETASKFSFLLVPISLPFIALLFMWRRGVTFFDHVVFSLYSLSFMSLLFVALAVTANAGDWTEPFLGVIAVTVPPVHMFFHMGGTYKLGWWSALWRTSFLLFFILFVIVIFAASILALGLLA